MVDLPRGITVATTTGNGTGGAASSTSAAQSSSKSTKTKKTTVASRPVHPAHMTVIPPGLGTAELSAWAYLTSPRPSKSSSSSSSAAAASASAAAAVATTAGSDASPLVLADAAATPLPNLVTAHASTLRIYVVHPTTGRLILASSHDGLAGNVCSLSVLPRATGVVSSASSTNSAGGGAAAGGFNSSDEYDGLLLGFSGHPRLSVVYPSAVSTSSTGGGGYGAGLALTASSIIDLTPALTERCLGSVGPLEVDVSVSVRSDDDGGFIGGTNTGGAGAAGGGIGGGGGTVTAAAILGGGVAVATLSFVRAPRPSLTSTDSETENASSSRRSCWWRVATEPYILPLPTLSSLMKDDGASGPTSLLPHLPARGGRSRRTDHHAHTSAATVGHGFGEILASSFLRGYTEPTLALLHSNPRRPGGRAWTGRWGRNVSSGARNPLCLTAVSLSIGQRRSVVLWTRTDGIPSDSYEMASHPLDGVAIMGVNTVTHVGGGGRVKGCLAVNGFARAGCPASLLPRSDDDRRKGGNRAAMEPNPSPLKRIALRLDGASMTFVSAEAALVSTEDGSLHSLEFHQEGGGRTVLSLSPLGYKVGGCGAVSTLAAWPLVRCGPSSSSKMRSLLEGASVGGAKTEAGGGEVLGKKASSTDATSVGLVFAGSAHGDSSLLLYGMREKVALNPLGGRAPEKMEKTAAAASAKEKGSKRKRDIDEMEDASGISPKVKKEEADVDAIVTPVSEEKDNSGTFSPQSLTEEEILRREEEELYGDDGAPPPDVIPPSSDEEDDSSSSELSNGRRPAVSSLSVFHGVRALDSLTGLGPLAQGCDGPVAPPHPFPAALGSAVKKEEGDDGDKSNSSASALDASVAAAAARSHVVPCGFGTGGGLAVLTGPGRDGPGRSGSTVVSESDCYNVENVFGLPRSGLVLLGKREGGGTMALRLEEDDEQGSGSEGTSGMLQLCEMDIDAWCGEGNGDRMDTDAEPSFDDARDVLGKMTLLLASEWSSPLSTTAVAVNDSLSSPISMTVIMLVKSTSNDSDRYAIVFLSEDADRSSDSKQLRVDSVHRIDDNILVGNNKCTRGSLLSLTTIENATNGNGGERGDDVAAFSAFGCVWSSGHGSLFTVSTPSDGPDRNTWSVKESIFVGELEAKKEEMTDGDDDEAFYRSDDVVALDVFVLEKGSFAPSNARPAGVSSDEAVVDPIAKTETSPPPMKSEAVTNIEIGSYQFDADDLELYGSVPDAGICTGGSAGRIAPDESANVASGLAMTPSRLSTLGGYAASNDDNGHMYIAICRRSGQISVYDIFKLCGADSSNAPAPVLPLQVLNEAVGSGRLTAPVWQAFGCGHGVPILSSDSKSTHVRRPRMHDVEVAEVRFFISGPSTNKESAENESDVAIFRSLCLLINTNLGDMHLYMGCKRDLNSSMEFTRIPLGTVSRPSEEEGRHNTKLRRKGIISPSSITSSRGDFRPIRLHRFRGISGQDGLFAATSRPLWFVSERGSPTVIHHKTRHVAPAGGRPFPVTYFCANLLSSEVGRHGSEFLTLHERIGRVGSQRLSLFTGLSDVFTPHGLLPGGGLCIQKIPLGVTVRRIKFIDDASISSLSHPLYIMLVSRELEADQSRLNDDGLTPEERQQAKDEKEAAKTQRQVEADLGGFDIEQEWVEEIEREDCFEVDMSLGGAPPIPSRVYELWLVDASNGWGVIDTFQLGEYEHGMAMEVMPLSEVKEESGTSSQTIGEEVPTKSLFITVGTGIVDRDGEDIGSRGRVLLFEVQRQAPSFDKTYSGPVAELSLTYEKEITLGPVTSLSCLSCENKSRLVVGAGAEVTVEQWGSDKLTQVGFFHANMQIQEIRLFKTFFLLSDAYDSLHFLVWRESDKSLTLLAKDYEPTSIYATGLMSRAGSMSFVCHDDRQNLQFFQYSPNDTAARGGNKLVCRADFHLGAQTVALQSHWCRSSLLINSATPISTLAALKQQDTLFGRIDDDQRFAVHFGTSDGGFGSVIPLSEPIYWRLTALQSVMSNALESDCSLSHRAWRLFRRTPRRGGCRSNDRKKGVIDGDLVRKYADLPLSEQEDLASAIGSTVGLILDNILELGCASLVV